MPRGWTRRPDRGRARLFPRPAPPSAADRLRVARSRRLRGPNGAVFCISQSQVTGHGSRLLDAPEALVMVVRIVKLAALPRDDAPCAAAFRPRRANGVLAVIAARPSGQLLLEIAEDRAVALV